MKLASRRLRSGTYGKLKMSLDKISGVTLRITRGEKLVHTRYVGSLSRGAHTLGWQVPRRRGLYTVTLAVRDLAGNPGTATGDVEVLEAEEEEALLVGSVPGHMAPRTILYTGKGGVGKTSVATATARRCAAAGARTLVLSTDPAHSLAESLETAVGGTPTDVGDGLFAQQIQAQDELERHWSGVQRWLGSVLVERGVDRIAAEELTVPPGGDELFSLLALKAHHESGDWDVIVVDCAPTGETLRLLSFPDAA